MVVFVYGGSNGNSGGQMISLDEVQVWQKDVESCGKRQCIMAGNGKDASFVAHQLIYPGQVDVN